MRVEVDTSFGRTKNGVLGDVLHVQFFIDTYSLLSLAGRSMGINKSTQSIMNTYAQEIESIKKNINEFVTKWLHDNNITRYEYRTTNEVGRLASVTFVNQDDYNKAMLLFPESFLISTEEYV